MKNEESIHRTDAQIVALLAVMLACLVGLIALLFQDPPIDPARLQPFAAHAAAVPARSVAAAPVATTKVTPEENWAADDASHGLRPDAAH